MSSSAQPITLEGFPRAILHVDADAFYTSVEEAMHPELRGRPVVTGKERGIISCANYPARALGIRRGVRLADARRMCPSLVILPSDYETYSIFSTRMFTILRRYAPVVEPYSVDEGFADLTGLQRVLRKRYRELVEDLRETLRRELGITVSAGLSLTKTLAKLASSCRKPDGFTPIAGYHIHVLLLRTPIGKVWGIGPKSAALLEHHGVHTAYDYVCRPEEWAGRMLDKPGREVWRELRGDPVHPVEADTQRSPLTLCRCKTFGALSRDREYVRARVLRNLESALIKVRRFGLLAGRVTVALRRADFTQWGAEGRFQRPTDVFHEAVPVVASLFEQVYVEGEAYRTAVVVLMDLCEKGQGRQLDLFEDAERAARIERLPDLVDEVARRYGKHTLTTGQALALDRHPASARDQRPWRQRHLLPGETSRKRLNIPQWDIEV